MHCRRHKHGSYYQRSQGIVRHSQEQPVIALNCIACHALRRFLTIHEYMAVVECWFWFWFRNLVLVTVVAVSSTQKTSIAVRWTPTWQELATSEHASAAGASCKTACTTLPWDGSSQSNSCLDSEACMLSIDKCLGLARSQEQ